MPSQLRVLRVFLASPSDLQDEREAVREVVRGLNHSIGRRLGAQLELLGWEDTRPGYGRPQALINPEVEMCDLFIGLLWKRWGTQTGAATSGFEEEFNIAMRRRELHSSPEIWMHFKHIPNSSLRDPGEQLQRVLAFRRTIQDSRQLLYKDFKNTAALKSLLYESMSAYLLDLNEKNPKEAEPQSVSGSSSVTQADHTIDVPSPLVTATQALGSLLNPGSSFGPEQVARLNLWAAALMSFYRQGDHFGTHSTNFIYGYRSNVQLTTAEARYLFETLVSDDTDTKPGWYWFRDSTIDGIVTLPVDTSINISYSFIQGYLKVLHYVQRLPPHHVIEQIAADADEQVRQLLVDHLFNVATSAQVDTVNGLFPEAQLNRMQLGALAREWPLKALHTLLESADVVPGVFQMIPAETIRGVPREVLVEAQDHTDLDIRRAVITELDRRDMIDPDYLHRLKVHSRLNVRLLAYRIMARRRLVTQKEINETFKDDYTAKDELALEYFRSFTDEELVNAFELIDMDTYPALQILIERGHVEFTHLVGQDLLTSGDRVPMLRNRWNQILQTTYDRETANRMIQLYDNSNGVLKLLLVRAGLQGLLTTVPPISRDIAVKWADSGTALVRVPAIELIAKVATVADVDLLVALATSNFGELQQKCAESAFNLRPTDDGPAMQFVQSDDVNLRRLGLKLFASRNVYLPDHVVLPLLRSEHAMDRTAAVAYFACFKSRADLENLLNQYLEGHYYYNVVVWLDRIVYAPAMLAQSFKASLFAAGHPHFFPGFS